MMTLQKLQHSNQRQATMQRASLMHAYFARWTSWRGVWVTPELVASIALVKTCWHLKRTSTVVSSLRAPPLPAACTALQDTA